MPQTPPISDERLADYVLGRLPEDEAERLDEASIADDEFAARLVAIEHDLFDAYAAGELAADRSARFEEIFGATETGRRRIAVARELRSRSQATPATTARQPITRMWWMAAAAAVMLVVGTARMLWPRNTEPRSEPPVAAEPGVTPAPPVVVASNAAVFVLSPRGSRSAEGAPPVVIPPQTRTVTLRLTGEPGVAAFPAPQVVIQSVEGREVFRGPGRAVGASADNAIAEANVDASLLAPDDYIVQLDAPGRETDRIRYFLRVRAQ
jgi:hypothetical protein